MAAQIDLYAVAVGCGIEAVGGQVKGQVLYIHAGISKEETCVFRSERLELDALVGITSIISARIRAVTQISFHAIDTT